MANDKNTYQEFILVWDAPAPLEFGRIYYRSPNFALWLNDGEYLDYYIQLKLRRQTASDFDIFYVEVHCGTAVVKSISLLNTDNETVTHIKLKECNKLRGDILAKGKFIVRLQTICSSPTELSKPIIWLEGKTDVSQTKFMSVTSENDIKKFSIMLNKNECPITITKIRHPKFRECDSARIEVGPIPRLWGIIFEGVSGGLPSFKIDSESSYDCTSVMNVYTYNYIPFDKMGNGSILKISTIMNKATGEHPITSQVEIAKVQPLITEHLSANPAMLYQLYIEKKLCDITIQSNDSKIRAHKVVLASCSSIWRDILIADMSLDIIHIVDFDIGTIMELIAYIYTRNVTPSSSVNYEQLFLAADKYKITGLKERCEELLMEAISLKNVVNLAVLAHQYKAPTLLDKVFAFIRENYAEFKELKEFESIFFVYPELAIMIVKL